MDWLLAVWQRRGIVALISSLALVLIGGIAAVVWKVAARRLETLADSHLDHALERLRPWFPSSRKDRPFVKPSLRQGYVDPAKNPPTYTEDLICGLKWRWSWGAAGPGEWTPERLRCFCPRPGCDLPVEPEITYLDGQAVALYSCGSGICEPVYLDEEPEFTYRHVLGIIARNQRQDWRGTHGPLEIRGDGEGI